MNKAPAILGILVLAALLLAFRMARTAKARNGRRPGGGNPLGWALLFLASGRMPPPPPESQIETELSTEKDRGAADPLRSPAAHRPRGDDDKVAGN